MGGRGALFKSITFALLLLALSSASEEAPAEVGFHDDDVSQLEFSLLQTNLLLHGGVSSRADAESSAALNLLHKQPVLLFGAPVSFFQLKVGELQESCSVLGQLLTPTGRSSLLSSFPSLLIFSLAVLIGVVLIIQVISIMVEEPKSVETWRERSPNPHAAARFYAAQNWPESNPASSASLPQRSSPPGSLGPASFPLSGRQTLGAQSTPGLQPPRSSMGPAFSSARPSTVPLPPSHSPPEPGRVDAICPALILPHGEAQFCIKGEALKRLVVEKAPAEILGPSGRPLLHARLPASNTPGLWLELSTTPQSRYPHANLGPIELGRMSSQPLEVRGPRGDVYGIMEPLGTGWRVIHDGRVVLAIELMGTGGVLMSAQDAVGRSVATASPVAGAALRVNVSPGSDAVLSLLCMLAIFLMSVDEGVLA